MKLLVRCQKSSALLNQIPPSVTLVALFGLGTIGGQIYKVLQQHDFDILESYKLFWGQPEFVLQMEQIRKKIEEHLVENNTTLVQVNADVKLEIIWSAGKAGFVSTTEQTEAEFVDYQLALNMVLRLVDQFPNVPIRFHLLSSAGGLFEGADQEINMETIPLPKRPYGFLKLRQEKALLECQKFSSVIYRPSSVYGFIAHNKRSGLIPTMIENGIKKKVSMISGSLNTLRDYVHAEDIAFFIVNKILDTVANIRNVEQQNLPLIHFLISGKPTSILEIKMLIEFYLRKKIYINFLLAPGNSANIIFHPSLLPIGFKSREINFGVKSVLQNWS